MGARQIGFTAEQVAQVDERLIARDPDGLPLGVRYMQDSAIYACAIQKLSADNDNIQHEIIELKRARR